MLVDDDREVYNVKPERLLFAALNHVNPRKLGKDLYVVAQGKDLLLFDRAGYNRHLQGQRHAKSIEDIMARYEQTVRFCAIVMKAYETDDYSQVIEEIYKYGDKLRAYMCSSRISVKRETQDELLAQTFDAALVNIRKKSAYVANLWGYLTRILRAIHGNAIQQKKLINSYDTYTMEWMESNNTNV